MNVIVSNRQKEIIDNANIDAIKDLNGLFNVTDLINKFKNYFFSRMILDATSVVDFASRDVLTTLANEIGAEKLIILLPSSPEPPMEFKKLLIELKIFNFTTSIDDVIKFIEKPNTYEDAIKLIDNSFDNNVYVDNSIKDETNDTPVSQNIPNNDMNTTSDEVQNNNFNSSISNNKSSLGDILNNLSIGNSYQSTNSYQEPNNVSPNFTENVIDHIETNNDYNSNNMMNSNGPSENKNTFLFTDGYSNTPTVADTPKRRVIGFKNVTFGAGSSSLIYMLHKMAMNNLKKDVLSIEIGKNDFRLFRDNKMISASENDVLDIINKSQSEVIFIDLNNYNNLAICDDVIYLVEPSTIKLNSLMATNKNIFVELRGKKVVLNKSLLTPNDVHTLESEAGLEFLCNIEPLNDRVSNDSIVKLLGLLGIN